MAEANVLQEKKQGCSCWKIREEIELGLIFDRQDRRFGGKTNERIVVLDPLPLSLPPLLFLPCCLTTFLC
jgi:hypothetical protein